MDDNASSMGAALAYYTVFSMAPLLVIVISVAGLVFGEEAARGELMSELQGLLGQDGAHAIEGLLESANKPVTSTLATIGSLAALLIGATTVFAELQNALDRIWRVPETALAGGIWGFLRSRVLSFGIILGFGFLLLVSLIASAALAALGKWWGPMMGAWEAVATVLNFILSFAVITAFFAMIYKFMPRLHIHWRDVVVGAVVTALLFTVGKTLIGLYIGKSGVASGFGAAASLVVLLVWVYYSAQIFLLGAEFTSVYAHTHGSLKGQERGSAAAPASSGARVAGPPQQPAAAAVSGRPMAGSRS
ncbi:YihY/virulence factor BrkB family protein [Aquabacterium sp. A7-Y]|uniref:YihY/virulence factor BrkB family protein n=1 Tax=Aquabacterium sp. A7-Y TaxID=1349605 RepID=UPI00223E2129|nr:YihY/virulence factor BrkB family protein [Aquabacterium sp. A7-Y]MCW7538451.1 YihY/virulence factor BrkB family protein [Aquabacterium sp. A7-Y]